MPALRRKPPTASSAGSGRAGGALARWILAAMWREQPGRTVIAILSIAIGVATALSIELVHRSALDDFAATLARIDGQAEARIEARGSAMDDALYAQWVQTEPASFASPVIDTRFPVADRPGTTLRVIGIDAFRAAEVTPALLPVPAEGETRGADSPLFSADAIFLSNAALAALERRAGERVTLVADGRPVSFRIAGTVPGAGAGERLAVLDLGTTQWRLGWLGRLSRIDLRFARGTDVAAAAARWQARLGQQAYWTTPQLSAGRAAAASRAYRVNLNVLALVAWFTGAFIVYSTLALAVERHRHSFAVLDALGAPPRWIGRFALAHGLAVGVPGAALGLAGGAAGAAWLLGRFGADLGGGYFTGGAAVLRLDPLVVLAFGLAGVATGALGACASVWRQQREATSRRLQDGTGAVAADGDARTGGRGGPRERPAAASRSLPLALILAPASAALGAILLPLPAAGGIPWAAYAAIALWLIAAIALLTPLTGFLSTRIGRRLALRARVPAWLAIERLASAPRSAAAASAPIVVSFALAVAMIVMVASFRASFDDWLERRLPADAYGQTPGDADGAALDAAARRRIAAAPGVARAEFSRALAWKLDPARPPATILVRPLADADVGRRLLTIGRVHAAPAGTVAIFASEAMADLYGFTAGATLRQRLPLPGSSGPAAAPDGRAEAGIEPGPGRHRSPADAAAPEAAPDTGPAVPLLFVAGIVRDYAHQHGSIVIDASSWQALGGDARASQAAVWFDRTTMAAPDWPALRAATASLAGFEWRDSGAVRARALRLFDRSFAVTHALEAIAIAVALFGAASVWAGEGLARRREFALLACLGFTHKQIRRSFITQAGWQLGIALVWGTLIGLMIALVLIHRVNPQSFHWTMELHWPGATVFALALALFALGTVTAALTIGRGLHQPERTLREAS